MNPTGQPFDAPPASSNNSNAVSELNVPSILLMVTAGLAVLFILLGLAMNLLGASMGSANDAFNNPNLPPIFKTMRGGGAMQVVVAMVQLASNAFIFWGALQMRAAKNWPVSLAAAILAMIPCFTSCCCLIGLAGGIWSIVVMVKPDIKAQFS